VVARVLDRQQDAVPRVAMAIRGTPAVGDRARGAGQLGQRGGLWSLPVRSLQSAANVACRAVWPDVVRSRAAPRSDGVIGVSQSGQGEDVVAYVRAARQQGAVTVAIVNDEQSPLAQTAERVLACQAGPEVSVACHQNGDRPDDTAGDAVVGTRRAAGARGQPQRTA